jgi:hypothetical protein
MRPLYFLFVCTVALLLISCGGKNSTDNETKEADTLTANQPDSATAANSAAAALLATAKPFIEKELNKWAQSFTGFSLDSLQFTQKGNFEQIEYESATELKKFYPLYKASLSFSPDSSQFIDLYSSGITLEKKGKKIIAIGDVDQAVTLCNVTTKEWKRILFFGPSAGIEEAVWTSPTQFILAGMMHNDDGKAAPILLMGDVTTKTFHWYEAKTTRQEGSKYESGAMKNLKIDEWE